MLKKRKQNKNKHMLKRKKSFSLVILNITPLPLLWSIYDQSAWYLILMVSKILRGYGICKRCPRLLAFGTEKEN